MHTHTHTWTVTCSVTCASTRRIRAIRPSPAHPAASHPPDARCSRQIACAAAIHLIHRLRCSFFGLPTCSSLALLGLPGSCQSVIGRSEGLSQERSTNGTGKIWEGQGTGPGPGTGTGRHLVDSDTLNSNNRRTDSTQHIAAHCVHITTVRPYINQSRLPISPVLRHLSSLSFFPATARTLASASHVSPSKPRTHSSLTPRASSSLLPPQT